MRAFFIPFLSRNYVSYVNYNILVSVTSNKMLRLWTRRNRLNICRAASHSQICPVHGAHLVCRGVATRWTGVDMPIPLLPHVVSEIDANPVSFTGRVRGRSHLELDSSVCKIRRMTRSCCLHWPSKSSTLATCIRPTFFELATPLPACADCLRDLEWLKVSLSRLVIIVNSRS